MVVEQEAVSLQLTPEAVAFRALGDTLRLVAEGVDANGHPVAVIWSSSDTTVAQMDASGLVTAVGYGTATIIATAGTLLWYGEPGDTLRLTATALDANGHPVESIGQFGWSSSLASVATVDAGGLVRGAAEGVTRITATADSLRASTELTVINRDRAALVALFHATGGPNWERSRNWLTSPDMRDWDGVIADLRRDGVVAVRSLGLHENNLTGAIPPELWTLASLESLSLSSNALTGPIPPELGAGHPI